MSAWREVESIVHRPGSWLLLAVGAAFLSIGTATYLFTPRGNAPTWFLPLFAGVFCWFGGLALVHSLADNLMPARIRHAANDVLPGISPEPEILEGAIAHGRLTHELARGDGGWELRPNEKLWRADKRFLIGFGIPFCAALMGILTWVLHREGFAWPVAGLIAFLAATFCGGTTLLLMGLMMRASYRRLCRLSVPSDGSTLEWEGPVEVDMDKVDFLWMKWVMLGDDRRKQLTIPRRLVAAAQLCPWKYVVGSANGRSVTWAVQGLLVIGPTDDGTFHRLPLLLTGDCVGAARLMRELAARLGAPFLFHADRAGWQAESIRAKTRLPLRAGGTQS